MAMISETSGIVFQKSTSRAGASHSDARIMPAGRDGPHRGSAHDGVAQPIGGPDQNAGKVSTAPA